MRVTGELPAGVERPPPWWRPRGVLLRFISDLVADELSRQRRESDRIHRPWHDALSLADDLGADSLERMGLASTLAAALHLHESGIEDYLLARHTLGGWTDVAEAGLARFSSTLTFHTSGSSGSPKPCIHTLATLHQEIGELAQLFAGRRRVLCAVPSHHIYGFLFTVLLPRALRLDPEAVVELRGSTPAWLARGAQPGDLVIGHPGFWQAVAQTVPQLPPDVVGVTSTAPCPDAVSAAVEAAGVQRLFQIYGSTETAGVGWRGSHRHAYQLFAHWRFSDSPRELLRQAPDGNLTAFAAQDRLDALTPRSFLVGPRHDNAVQVGGTNVFPDKVAEVLRQHPGVAGVAVRLMRPDEGARLKAYVVPRPEASDRVLLHEELRSWIDRQLTAPERPKAIRFGDRLPTSGTDKPADWSLAAE